MHHYGLNDVGRLQIRWNPEMGPSLAPPRYPNNVEGQIQAAYHTPFRYPTFIVSFGFISPLSGVLLSALLLGDVSAWDLAVGIAAAGFGLAILAPRARPRLQS